MSIGIAFNPHEYGYGTFQGCIQGMQFDFNPDHLILVRGAGHKDVDAADLPREDVIRVEVVDLEGQVLSDL